MYRNHNMNTACVMLSKRLWGQCIPNKLFFINTKDRFLVSLSGESEEETSQLYGLPQLGLHLAA